MKFGKDALNTFSEKVYALHVNNPAWAVHVDTEEKLKDRTVGMLRRLEVQCWTELMEGLMAANCSKDYLDMSNEAVLRFPDDEVFPSEGKQTFFLLNMPSSQTFCCYNKHENLLLRIQLTQNCS